MEEPISKDYKAGLNLAQAEAEFIGRTSCDLVQTWAISLLKLQIDFSMKTIEQRDPFVNRLSDRIRSSGFLLSTAFRSESSSVSSFAASRRMSQISII